MARLCTTGIAWVGDVGDGGGEAVDGGDGGEALQEDAPPPGGDGTGAKQLVHAHAVPLRQKAQTGGGEVEPPRQRDEVRSVGDGSCEPSLLQPPDAPVHRALRPAGDGGELHSVEEGHLGQTPQQLLLRIL